MIWQEEMKRDAVKVAFPGFELQDTDDARITGDWQEGYAFESTFEETRFSIFVFVIRDGTQIQHREFKNEEAQSFFVALMRRASLEEVNALDVMTRIAKREALRDPLARDKITDVIRRSIQGMYENAMYYLSVNEYTRGKVHELVEQGQHGNPRYWAGMR